MDTNPPLTEAETTAIIGIIDSVRGDGRLIEWTDPKTNELGRIWVKKNGRAIPKRTKHKSNSYLSSSLTKMNRRAADDFNRKRVMIEEANDYSFKRNGET